jgi:hypothetical protein
VATHGHSTSHASGAVSTSFSTPPISDSPARGTDAGAASTCFGSGKLHGREIQDDVVPPIRPNHPAK